MSFRDPFPLPRSLVRDPLPNPLAGGRQAGKLKETPFTSIWQPVCQLEKSGKHGWRDGILSFAYLGGGKDAAAICVWMEYKPALGEAVCQMARACQRPGPSVT